MDENNSRNHSAHTPKRYYHEFWIICFVVSLGLENSFSIGFYRFRLVDLILILSFFYFVKLIQDRRIELKSKRIMYLCLAFIGVRIFLDFGLSAKDNSLQTLLGMSATFLAPVVFFVVRESRIDYSFVKKILVAAVIIVFLSQLGLLGLGERHAFGTIDIGRLLKLPSYRTLEIDYQEHTITIWRALAIGLTFAVILSNTKTFVKIIGIVGLLLQIGGGGGTRGGGVFIFVAPIILFLMQRKINVINYYKKLSLAIVIGVILGGIYLWAPFDSGELLEKTNYTKTHYERSSEIFLVLTGDWDKIESMGGYNGRTRTYLTYVNNIFSDYRIFFWGVGLYHGAAFSYLPNQQAHNAILDIWALSGLIGLLIFLIVQYHVITDLRQLIKTGLSSTKEKIVVFSIAIAVLYFYQPLLFQAPSSARSFMIVFYLTAGLLKPLRRWVNGESQH